MSNISKFRTKTHFHHQLVVNSSICNSECVVLDPRPKRPYERNQRIYYYRLIDVPLQSPASRQSLLLINSFSLLLCQHLHPSDITKSPNCQFPEKLCKNHKLNPLFILAPKKEVHVLRNCLCGFNEYRIEDVPLILVALVLTFPRKVVVLFPTNIQRDQEPDFGIPSRNRRNPV